MMPPQPASGSAAAARPALPLEAASPPLPPPPPLPPWPPASRPRLWRRRWHPLWTALRSRARRQPLNFPTSPLLFALVVFLPTATAGAGLPEFVYCCASSPQQALMTSACCPFSPSISAVQYQYCFSRRMYMSRRPPPRPLLSPWPEYWMHCLSSPIYQPYIMSSSRGCKHRMGSQTESQHKGAWARLCGTLTWRVQPWAIPSPGAASARGRSLFGNQLQAWLQFTLPPGLHAGQVAAPNPCSAIMQCRKGPTHWLSATELPRLTLNPGSSSMEGGGQADLKQLAGKSVELFFEQVRPSQTRPHDRAEDNCSGAGRPHAQCGGQYSAAAHGIPCHCGTPCCRQGGSKISARSSKQPLCCSHPVLAPVMLQEEEWQQGVVVECISKS